MTVAGVVLSLGLARGAMAQPAEAPAPPPPPPPPPPVAPQAAEPPATSAAPTSAAPTPLPSGEDTAARPPISLLKVIQTTLRQHPQIRLAQASLAASRADHKAARGPFDPVLLAAGSHDHEEFPVLPPQRAVPEQESTVIDTTSLDLGASWSTTWGTTLLPSVGLSRIHQRSPGAPLVSLEPFHQSNVNLTVTQALLRNAGRVGAASAVDATALSQEGAKHLVAHTAQERVLLAVTAYWQLAAASESVRLLRATEAGALKLVEDMKILVESDQRPRSDLGQLEGNLANRTREVQAARNTELAALYALYETMGLSAGKAPRWRPSDSLPPPDAAASINPAQVVRRARDARRDLRAAKDFVGSTAALVRGADWNTKPALDLSVSVGYNGALDRDGADAFFLAAGSNVPGVNAGVALSLELPVRNTVREAAHERRRADYDQAKIAAADLERRLPIQVLSAVNDLRLSAAALEASSRAVAHFEQALADEQDRLRGGLSTVLDMVLTQEQLIRAQLNRIGDHLRYAIALARLQFEIGSLPDSEAEAMSAVAALTGPRPPRAAGANVEP